VTVARAARKRDHVRDDEGGDAVCDPIGDPESEAHEQDAEVGDRHPCDDLRCTIARICRSGSSAIRDGPGGGDSERGDEHGNLRK
jgi:hypothetical protein